MSLRAGSATVEITPRQACPIIGYDMAHRVYRPGETPLHRPLMARALCLECGGVKLLLVSLDLCLLYTPVADYFRARLSEELKLPRAQIILACSHTHSGPLVEHPAVNEARAIAQLARPEWTEAHQAYGVWLEEQLLAVAHRAVNLTYPVELGYRAGRFDLGYNRRVFKADGKITHDWNPQQYPEHDPRPSPDPTVSVLTLRQPGGPRRSLLYSAGLHPVCLGRTSGVLSPDFVGFADAALEAAGWAPHFLQGASGEVHPWVATQERPQGAELVGAALGQTVALLAEATKAASLGADALAAETVSVEVATGTVEATIWRLGDLRLLGLPVEWFARLSASMRDAVEAPLIFATMANGWEAYWPDAATWDEHGYEVWVAEKFGRQKGDAEALQAALKARL